MIILFENYMDDIIEVYSYPSGAMYRITKAQLDLLDDNYLVDWNGTEPELRDEDGDEISQIINEKILITGFPKAERIEVSKITLDALKNSNDIFFDQRINEWRFYSKDIKKIEHLVKVADIGIIN